MTTINFEDAIAELLHQIYSVSPKDKNVAVMRSRRAIDAMKRSSLRLVPGQQSEFSDKVPD